MTRVRVSRVVAWRMSSVRSRSSRTLVRVATGARVSGASLAPSRLAPLVPLVSALVCSCSSTAPPAASEAGVDAGVAPPDVAVVAAEAKQTGRAVVVQQATPIAGATVSAAGKQTTTDADGKYTLTVPRGKPFTLRFVAPEHYQLVEQEYVVEAESYDRGDSLVLAKQTATLLAAFLDGYDKARGLLAVRVVAMPGCASEGGAVVALEAPAGSSAQVKYTTNGVPGSGTSLSAGENNGALFYNVPVGVPVRVTATHPTCAQLALPVVYQGIKYTSGLQTTEAGESLAFVRVFLGPGTGTARDAGAD